MKYTYLYIYTCIKYTHTYTHTWGFPSDSDSKESTCNAGDIGSIPGLGRPPGEGKGYLLQYSGLENSMNCIVHGVAKSQTRLRDFHFHPRQGRQSTLLSLPSQMLISSPNTLQTLRIMLDQISGLPGPVNLTHKSNHHQLFNRISFHCPKQSMQLLGL